MALRLRPGDQLAAVSSTTRVIVIRASERVTDPIECDGVPMVPSTEAPPAPSDEEPPDTLIGKRYVDATDSLELLCTASGTGHLTCGGQPLQIKAPKALPASD